MHCSGCIAVLLQFYLLGDSLVSWWDKEISNPASSIGCGHIHERLWWSRLFRATQSYKQKTKNIFISSFLVVDGGWAVLFRGFLSSVAEEKEEGEGNLSRIVGSRETNLTLGLAMKCFIPINWKIEQTAKKLFARRRLEHNLAVLSRCKTWFRASRNLKLLGVTAWRALFVDACPRGAYKFWHVTRSLRIVKNDYHSSSKQRQLLENKKSQ